MKIIKFFHLSAMLFIFFCLIEMAYADTGKFEKTATFIAIADIHFNPFYGCEESVCPIINRLQAAPVEKWNKLLKQYDNKKPIYNKNTNYILFQSMLNAL